VQWALESFLVSLFSFQTSTLKSLSMWLNIPSVDLVQIKVRNSFCCQILPFNL
jgi:hypothetical protein